MNNACRGHGGTNESPHVVPLILVGTAGVHVRLFCDFGPSFVVVVDEDGKTSRSTLLHSVEEVVNDDGDAGKGGMKLYSVHCQNDVKYHWSNLELFSSCHSGSEPPQRIKLQRASLITDTSSSIATSFLERKARSFAWIKLPNQIAFLSLREILRPNDKVGSIMTSSSNCWNDKTLFTPSGLNKSFDPIR
jgi:hypothetical protein